MIRIVERREAASSEDMVFEFKVYRSAKDHQTVFGHMSPRGFLLSQNTMKWVFIPFGVPVSDAFRAAVSLCESLDNAVLWVNDPKGYFPRSSRPVSAQSLPAHQNL